MALETTDSLHCVSVITNGFNNKRREVAAPTAQSRCKVLSIKCVYYFRAYQRQRTLHGIGVILLLLGGELLAERCRTDYLMPSIPISCLPPCCMDPKVQGLDILIYCSQPGGSWRPTGLLQSVGGLSAAAMTRW